MSQDEGGKGFFNWLSKPVKSLYVARPQEHASDLIYRYEDQSIPRGAKLTVRSDECVLFFREGKYIGRINAGTVLLDTANMPFLGHLVDTLTGANHFICELFFVSQHETIFEIPASSLGQYKDRSSANVVAINAGLSYTIFVSDPAELVIKLGGQRATSGDAVEQIATGTVLNQLRKVVGAESQSRPVLDIVSNFDVAGISEKVKELANVELGPRGLEVRRIYDLILSLDKASLDVLREFGQQEAGLKLATSEGFAEFNLVKGQRAALEGLGEGLKTGHGAMIMGGMNFGAGFTGGSRPAGRPAAARSGPVLGGQASFFLRTDSGETGPYSARQIALMAISKGTKLADMVIRSTEDSENFAFSADQEPLIVAEYKRRLPAEGSTPPNGQFGAFDVMFKEASKDGKITPDEMNILTNLAVTLGLDHDIRAAEARIRAMAAAAGVTIAA